MSRWERDEAITPVALEKVRRAIVDCLVSARGGTIEAQVAYLEGVLVRAGVHAEPTWADYYAVLGVLRDDALAEGADAAMVRRHTAQLQRILEQVED